MKSAEQQKYLRAEALAGRGVLIELTKGLVTLVDVADFAEMAGQNWYAQKARNNFYAARRVGGKIVLLQRVLMSPLKGLVVDHWNKNTLDNRRQNLRVATYTQNAANSEKPFAASTSRYKGVCWVTEKGAWKAQVRGFLRRGGQHIGYFDTAIDAAHAYDKAALELFGEFASLNFPTKTNETKHKK